jgi:hypothetical protein
MAIIGRPKTTLELSDHEREELTRMARAIRRDRHGALRARIVLACGEGLSNRDVAHRLGLAEHTIGKWRGRFVQYRLEGLSNAPAEPKPAVSSGHLLRFDPWGVGAAFGLSSYTGLTTPQHRASA